MPDASNVLQFKVVNVVMFLASDDAGMVTGSVYGVDGGWGIRA